MKLASIPKQNTRIILEMERVFQTWKRIYGHCSIVRCIFFQLFTVYICDYRRRKNNLARYLKMCFIALKSIWWNAYYTLLMRSNFSFSERGHQMAFVVFLLPYKWHVALWAKLEGNGERTEAFTAFGWLALFTPVRSVLGPRTKKS